MNANWIWRKQDRYTDYNQTVLFKKTFTVGTVKQAALKITADSWYRLLVNGQWVNDGPCRSWPEHTQYDEMDLTPFLRPGENELRAMVRFFGTGTFHTRPQQAGFLAQLEVEQVDGGALSIITDESWLAADAPAWIRQTPKVSIQMEPQELMDARLEDDLNFAPAAVLYPAGKGPWGDLNPRDVALLTRQPFALRSFCAANLVRRSGDLHVCVPAARLNYPDLIEANHTLSAPGALAVLVELSQPGQLCFDAKSFCTYVDGIHTADDHYNLEKGQHLVTAFITELVGHNKEKELRIVNPPDSLRLMNPLDAVYANPWCWVTFSEYAFADDDMRWPAHGLIANNAQLLTDYKSLIAELGPTLTTATAFVKQLASRARNLPAEELFVEDYHWLFLNRQVTGSAAAWVEKPTALMAETPELTVIHPSPDGDVELVYDLGEQNIGYYDLELIADAGVVLDVYGVEYITPQGTIQHSWGNRNGMRYITHAGVNRYTSIKRRSGRYLYLTLRNQTAPVRIRKLQLIESTYPVNAVGSFHCSDARLERIWEISARTLKLCMEDTFTDCPLYEQTHWVGDARNESAFAYPVFGAVDIGRRCITLTGQSLERYPIAGCQVPSTWDCLLPAWSFLWGISVWDYYYYTSDRAFLEQVWPWVVRNLEGAAALRDENGLFSGAFWNMFDWSGIDDVHNTVLHNSMLMVGAVDAALKCAHLLGDEPRAAWLIGLRQSLRESLNRLWYPEPGTYPDSIHEDGSISLSTSQHTSFLALLYDIIEPENAARALENVLNPPEGMVRVGSPFAMMYFLEALEKLGRGDEIVRSIYDSYLPMLEAGATTVWETFASSNVHPGEFPTRSHCHAWSSAPLYFLNRVVLGARPVEAGGAVFEVSPRLNGLAWASGTMATIHGPLDVSWRVEGSHLHIQAAVPEGVQVRFVSNDSHQGLTVTYDQVTRQL